MGVCTFSEDYLMLDVTAVDNLFIEEYMLRAPGDYVKVYLYGLRMCYSRNTDSTLGRVASVLGLEEDTVADAFSYWEMQGLVRRIADNPPSYEYINLRKAVLRGEMRLSDREAYPDGDFNAAVRGLLAGRVLHAADYARVYDWMDSFGYSPTAMLKVVGYYAKDFKVKGRKQPPTIAFLEKKVKDLAQRGIVTDDAVEDALYTMDDDVQSAKQLLRHMGILKGAPSVDEVSLYRKWRSWGFEVDLLKDLCREMTKIQTPNMAYLDRIVENYHDMGISAREDVEQYNVQAIMPLKELLGELGSSAKLNRPLVSKYLGWLAQGFTHEVLLRTARACKQRGGSTIDFFEEKLAVLREGGLYTEEALEQNAAFERHIRALAKEALALAGEPREPKAFERAQVKGWLAAGTPESLIPLAAQRAVNARDKLSFMNTTLSAWRTQGVASAEQANGAPAARTAKSGKAVAEQQYHQRAYDEKDLEKLLYQFDDQEDKA